MQPTNTPKTYELELLTVGDVEQLVREWYFDLDKVSFPPIALHLERAISSSQGWAEFVQHVTDVAADAPMSETIQCLARGCMAAFLMGWVANVRVRDRREQSDDESLRYETLIAAAEAIRDVDPSQTEPWELSQKIEAIDSALTALAVAETGDTSESEVISQDELLKLPEASQSEASSCCEFHATGGDASLSCGGDNGERLRTETQTEHLDSERSDDASQKLPDDPLA